MLTRRFLENKLDELNNLPLNSPNTETAREYRALKARQAQAYKREYYKALARDEAPIGELEKKISKGPYNLTYRPGSFNIDPARC